ncbi:MAG TPA: histidine phosphatase family protein [Cryomorphaceae bacterium]|nr:histidine phosphatase family protein [Cryomorphaceae bacterium]
MKTVYLIRHAKSSWEYPHLEDRERPLKGRGIRDAHLMAAWLAEEIYPAPFMVSSPATRALHTSMIFARNFGQSLDSILTDEALYEVSVEGLRSFLRGLPDAENNVMVFGHNPSHTLFLNRCVDQRIDNVPTAGVACLRFEVSTWADLDFDAELLFFDFPKNHKS